MSAYAELKEVPPPQVVETPTAPTPPRVSDPQEEASVRYWRKRIEKRKGCDDYKEWEAYKKEAKEFGKGNILDDDDVKSWRSHDKTSGAPVVQINLWKRIRNYFVDAIFTTNPNLAFRPKAGRSNEMTLKQASAVEAMVKYIWEECKQQAEARRALKDAYNSNVSAVKTDYDPARGLYRARWVAGSFIVDGECHGDLSRAMWVAEELRLPASRILQDETFAADKRLRLYEKWKPSLEKVEGGGAEQLRTVYYVCSREGIDPLATIKELAASQGQPSQGDKPPRKVAFAIVEDFDEFLFQAPDPYPYLDEDEFNYPVLMLEEEPGEWYGSPQWKMLKGLIQAINWLVTFHVAAMKKKAASVTLVNESIWPKGEDELSDAAFMQVFGVKGDPNAAAAKLDLGSNDTGQLQSAEGLMEWLARLSGFNEVAQGESSGRKTAEEARYLQQNTSLVTKGGTVSFDQFLNEMVRQIALASLYYIPQYSRVIGPDGSVMTQQVAEVPAPPDPMTGMPAVDPMTGAPVTQQAAVPAPASPEDAQALGAVPFVLEDGRDYGLRLPDTQVEVPETGAVDEFGQPIPGEPIFTHERAGQVLRKGVDYFCGPEVAMNWPTQPLEDVKRDLLLTFEAGSTRADFRYDQQQAAMGAMNLLGGIYQQVGALDALYELLVTYTQSLPLENTDRLVPPRDVFMQGMQAAMMQAQAMQQQEQDAAASKEGREERKVGVAEKKAEQGPPNA